MATAHHCRQRRLISNIAWTFSSSLSSGDPDCQSFAGRSKYPFPFQVITNASFRTKKLPEDITVDEDYTGPNLSICSRSTGALQATETGVETSSGVYVTPPSFGENSSSRPASFLSASSSGRKSDKQRPREVEDVALEMTKM